MRKLLFLFCFLTINIGYIYAGSSIPFPRIQGQTLDSLSEDTLRRVSRSRENLYKMTGIPDSNDITSCIIEMETVSDDTNTNNVRAYVDCDDGDFIYDKTLPIEQHQEYKSEDGTVVLFPKDVGVYVLIDDSPNIDIISSRFVNLPSLPGKEMEAVIKIHDGRGTFTDFTCEQNAYGTKSGCLYFSDSANYAVENCMISYNRGHNAGAVTAIENTRVDFEFCDFYGNTGDKYAGSVYMTDYANVEIESSTFSGVPITENFKTSFKNSLANDDTDDGIVSSTPRAGAIAVFGSAYADIFDCTFTQLSGQLGTVFTIQRANTYIDNCKFIENYVSYAGGVYIENDRDGFTRIHKSVFEQNVARYGGAAVISGEGSFSLDESKFIGNTALQGGALYGVFAFENTTNAETCPEAGAYKGTEMTILECEFHQNIAQKSGGAFYTKCTDIVMRDTTVIDNVSGEDGGAFYIQYGWDLHFDNIKFENNVAVNKGGAVYIDDAHIVKSTYSSFNGNVVSRGEGGSLFINNALGLHIDSSNFYGSSARTGGAAISTSGVETFIASDFSIGECQGGGLGGAILSSGTKKMNLTNIHLYNNTADSAGAMSISTVDELNLENINFETNVAIFKDGGSLNIEKGISVNLKNLTFDQSRAYYSCGALRVYETDMFSIIDTDFISNVAQSMHGGAICLDKVEDALIEECKFEKSKSERSGGHIYFHESGTITLSNSQMEDGSAETGGSIGGEGLEHLTLTNMTIMNNAATLYGGAIYTDLAYNIEVKDSEFSSNFASLAYHETNGIGKNDYFYKCQGGAIAAYKGESFVSSNTLYQDCQADDRGGHLMIDDFVDVTLTNDLYLNGKTANIGGCLYVNGVNNMAIDNVEVMFCESDEGGAMYLDGQTELEITKSTFVNNSASTGGAVLCQGNTDINIESSLFNYNAAKDGATLTTDCYCNVSISDSTISRDDDSEYIGDFFYENGDSCSVISTNNVNFIGAIVVKVSLTLIIVLVVIFAIIGLLGTSGSMYYYLSKHKPGPVYTFSSDEENPEVDDLEKPLILPTSDDTSPKPPLPSGKVSSKPEFKRVPTDVGLPDDSSDATSDDSETDTDSTGSSSETEIDNDDDRVETKKRNIAMSSETQPLLKKEEEEEEQVSLTLVEKDDKDDVVVEPSTKQIEPTSNEITEPKRLDDE